MSLDIHPCTQRPKGCQVEVDGKCLEGIDYQLCSYFEAFAVPEESAISDRGDIQADLHESTFTTFHQGTHLGVEAARAITRKTLTRVIVIAGEPNTGKTTLLASLNHLFQKGPFGGFLFAGSLTLPGFEQISHEARIQSGRRVPATERTKRSDEPRFLHIALRADDLASPAQHLLLTDVSGEQFNSLRDSTDEAAKFTLLSRADHFVLMIDGAKLCDNAERHGAKQNAFRILRSCLDAGALPSRPLVDMVIAKWDHVEAASSNEDVRKYVRGVEESARESFAHRVDRLRFVRLAARPTLRPDLRMGFGLDELLSSWVNESALIRRARHQPLPLMSSTRSFFRFGLVDRGS